MEGYNLPKKKERKEKKIVGSFGAMHYYLRCGHAILLIVLVRFLQFVRFMWFGEHPYL